MKRTGTLVLYGLYTVLAAGFFFYALFPSQTVRRWIVAYVAQTYPGWQVQMETVRPVFPAGLQMTPLGVAYEGIPVASLDHLKVIARLSTLTGGIKAFRFNGAVGGGSVAGQAQWTMTTDAPQKFNVALNLNGIAIERIPIVTQLPQVRLTGHITSGFLDFDNDKGPGGTADVHMDANPVQVTFQSPLLGIEQLAFSRVQSEMTVTPQMLQIRRFDATGPQLETKINGSIVFREPLPASRINLSCMLKPQAGFVAEQRETMLGAFLGTPAAQQRGVLFRISGTLERPNYVVR